LQKLKNRSLALGIDFLSLCYLFPVARSPVNMTVLIITYSEDNESISLVTNAIEARGGNVFGFDTDRFPTEVQLDIYYGREKERVIL
jgi:hypothetical protein